MSDGSATVSLLAVDDDPLSLDLVRDALGSLGLRILTAATGAAGMALVESERPQIVLLDLMLPDSNGLELLEEITQMAPGTEVLLLTGHYTPESAVEAIRKGASDYLTKPVKIAALRARVRELVDDAARRMEAARLETELLQANRFQGMVGRSPQMLELFALIRRVAPHFRVALVRGATGTGKELAAHALHALSPAATGPFVIANCSAITETLFESEMFGHLKGAFTGANADKKGLFEAAHGGTLFLDELGDLPFAMQSKLLRAIQQQEIKPVGGTATRKISVRVVAATNRPLEEMMGVGTFREDLYYRLSMVEIHLPSLAERMEDFPFLVRHFVAHFAGEYGKRLTGVTPRAQALLARHGWPGNVRELENVIGSACMMADGEMVDARDLPPSFHRAAAPAAMMMVDEAKTETDGTGAPDLITLEELSQRHARAVLAHFGGNKSKAAEVLGVTRSTLYRLLGEA
jgi:DNA-binding NtrC family response regulator